MKHAISQNCSIIYRRLPSGVRGKFVYFFYVGYKDWSREPGDAGRFMFRENANEALRVAERELAGQRHKPHILKPGEVLK